MKHKTKEIPSIPETQPELSVSNIFKPTPKVRVIQGMSMKIISIGLVALGGTLLAMVTVVPDLQHTLLFSGIILNIVGLIGGAIGESIILFTKEEPVSSLFRAAEEIKLNPQQITIESANSEPTNECNPNPEQPN
jgi:hypothetical protein